MIVKAEHNVSKVLNPRFIVTNVPAEPQELYEDFYCQRGNMENRIKEQQLDLFADRTSCHRFLANQFRLLLSSAAYVLVQAKWPNGLTRNRSGEGPGRDNPGWKLFKVAARVCRDCPSSRVPSCDELPIPQKLFRALYSAPPRSEANAWTSRCGLTA